MARPFVLAAAMCVTAALCSQEAVAAPPPAPAATPVSSGDMLGQCFVNKSTAEDRQALIRWLVGALGSSDKVSSIVKVDPAELDTANRQVAALFSRLFTQDCVDIARPMLKNEGRRAFEVAGEALGRTAMQDMLADPKTANALLGYLRYIDLIAIGKLSLPEASKK